MCDSDVITAINTEHQSLDESYSVQLLFQVEVLIQFGEGVLMTAVCAVKFYDVILRWF